MKGTPGGGGNRAFYTLSTIPWSNRLTGLVLREQPGSSPGYSGSNREMTHCGQSSVGLVHARLARVLRALWVAQSAFVCLA